MISSNRSFYYFLAIVFLNGLLGNVVGYFLPVYFKELGFSGFQTGLYFSMSSIATILLSLPMGVSTDRWSIVAILVVSFFLMGLSKLGFVLTQSYAVFCIVAFIGAFGGRFYGTAISTLFFKMTGRNNEKQAGLYQLFSFVGMGLGMLLGGFLVADFSFHAMFVFAFAANWVLMALCLLLPRNEKVVIKLDDYKKTVTKPDVLFLTFVFMLSSLHWGAETTSYGPFLIHTLGLTAKQTGFYTAFGFFFVGLGAFGGYLLLRRRLVKDVQTLLAIGFLLAGAFHILMTVHNVYLSFVFRVVHEIGDGLVFLAYLNGITKVFGLDKIGGCAAFISLWQAVGSMSSAMAFGVIGEKFGHQWPLIISGIIMAVLPVLLKLRGRNLMPEPAVTAPAAVPVEDVQDEGEHY